MSLLDRYRARRWTKASGFASDNSDYPRISATDAAALFPHGSDTVIGLVHHSERAQALRTYRRGERR